MLQNQFSVIASSWIADHVLPNVQAWRPSQDVISTALVGTAVVTTIAHNYLTGWFCIVSTNGSVDALLNSANLAFALNRDGPPYIVRNNIGTTIADVGCQPIFAGSHYPIGGYT